ncbi:endonuclease/exonuclease/phosphatase family protein [Shewanella sp. GXUN23E]|uniref:endonuclease/exonuclease/phosphatase family protein n=1 Tax=Shewanella sp. GXUN23E TaxID=3422498 RepID=UPI003D7E4E8C
MKKKLIPALLSSMFLMACNSDETVITPDPAPVSQVKFAQFNLSFAVDNDPTENYDRWVEYMGLTVAQQDALISAWKKDVESGEAGGAEHLLAERVIQIRNVAAIIQKNRPDVLLMNEFNNDGDAVDTRVLDGFQKNYLSVSQSLSSVDGFINGEDMLEPIEYPFAKNYATNTGLLTEFDLNNDGQTGGADDAHGFGFYHGHYGFALLSKFEIDHSNTRTFQKFLRKDLLGAVNPVIEVCDGSKPIPDGMAGGDLWFNEAEWNALRLSSKNHVDAPILVNTPKGKVAINVLLAHPTPSGFDTVTYNNRYRNSEENLFWHQYLNGEESLYDDKGQKGGFAGQHFVFMGDMNADNVVGTQVNKPWDGIIQLLGNEKVNQSVAQVGQEFTPTSLGAAESKNPANNWNPVHTYPEIRTSVFGSRADYAVPSASLEVVDSGVYWAAEGYTGRLLFNDPRVGKYGDSKEVSSDHRFVWVTVKVD